MALAAAGGEIETGKVGPILSLPYLPVIPGKGMSHTYINFSSRYEHSF